MNVETEGGPQAPTPAKTYDCTCKVCERTYTSECADSQVCKDCRTGKRKK